jgi:uncharacterized protein YlxW (UPF0749 family)
MRKNGRQYIFLIVFLIFGIVVALQVKSTLYAKRLTASNTMSAETLKKELAEEQKNTDALQKSIDDNLAIMNNYMKAYLEQKNDVELTDDWDKIKLSTGLVTVKGPGITIKLDDAPAREPDTPINWQIIHDQDIKVILNELKKSGAQAIAINGERIVPMSVLVCAGPTILINDNRHSVPYYIEAIGNPDLLYDSISKCSRVAEMTQFKIRVDITKSKELKLAKFSGAGQLDRYISGLEVVKK